METSLLAIQFSEFQLFSDSKDELCATTAHPVSNIQHRGTEVDVSRSIIAVVRCGAWAQIGAEAVRMRGRFKSELQESKPDRLRSSLRVWR
jgi:hypothetical protein